MKLTSTFIHEFIKLKIMNKLLVSTAFIFLFGCTNAENQQVNKTTSDNKTSKKNS